MSDGPEDQDDTDDEVLDLEDDCCSECGAPLDEDEFETCDSCLDEMGGEHLPGEE